MSTRISITTVKIITVAIITSAAIFATVFPFIIFHGSVNNSSSQTASCTEKSIFSENISSVEDEVLSSDTAPTVAGAVHSRTAPVPKNYVEAIKKDEVQINKSFEEPATTPPTKLINVPYINQKANYPSGCESVSAVMNLNYWGYAISVNSFIDNYLDKAITPYIGDDGNYYGYDPREYFLGDPYSVKGWGCLAPVIVTALNRCIDRKYHSVNNITGTSLPDLRSYLDRDIPVIIWATQDMQESRESKTWTIVDTGKTYTWTAPNHCLLLIGYDDTGYYFNDPLTHANCRYPAEVAENRYNRMGRQSVIITAKAAVPDLADDTILDTTLSTVPEENQQTKSEENTQPDASHEIVIEPDLNSIQPDASIQSIEPVNN